MSDLNSKIEAAKEKVASLKQQIVQIQSEKKDTTLGKAAAGVDPPLANLRSPPAVKTRRTLKGHFGKVTAMHWGGDSRTLVSASQDGNLLVWNAFSSNKLQSISLKSSYVMSVGIEQSQGNLIACGGLDNLCTVYRRGAAGDSSATEMASHDGFLSCCRFVNEQQMITASGDSTCILWDVSTAKPISTFAEHKADAMFLSIFPDKKTFVSCSVDQTAKVWDIRAPKASVMTFMGHTADVNCVEVMPSDGKCFATCSQDSTVRFYDMRSMNELQKFSVPAPPSNNTGDEAIDEQPDTFTSLAFSGSGRLIFCGHADSNVYAFDTLGQRSSPVYTIASAHDRHISCVGVAPSGAALATGSWDSQLKVWA
eukprot:CAMPEP_0172473088 /NCGR_PEP_ID=MMETSP1065-20121228/68677_1 /TAXON_ID=265537 /ORGANISM="Amphiprora paludosa, Strain CCMP125" /LENGTH=366 /DNA_ID=CAMNT_0013231257 /DNA_START=402 /DNA_END=1502 /DNA_ORIENTATION=-